MKAKVSVLSLSLLLCMFFLSTAQLSTAQAQEERKWFDLSDFNPFGHALDNVEECVPGLWLKGIIWSNPGLFLNGKGREFKSDVMRGNPTPPAAGKYNSNPGLAFGARKRNWTFEKIDWFTELEARYVPPSLPNLEFVSIWDFRYNALYDWDHSFKHSFGALRSPARRNTYPALKEADEYYNDTKRIWREFYLKWTPPNWIIQLGKQQFVWSKVDTKVMDDLFPFDYRHGSGGQNPYLAQANYEYLNIPFWSLSVLRQITPNIYFHLIWKFDYERDYFYPGGWVWAKDLNALDNVGVNPQALTTRMKADMPSWNIKNHDWIARLGFNIGRWNSHLLYAYVWDTKLTPFRRAMRIVGGAPRYFVEPKPTRVHFAGLATDTNFWFLNRNWAFFGEFYFLLNKYVPNLMESPIALGLASPLLNKYDGVTKRTLFKGVFGVESYFLKDFSFILYWNPNYLFGRDGGIIAPQPASPKAALHAFFLPSMTWRAPFTEDRWYISYTNMLTAPRFTSKQYIETGYTFSNYLKASVGFHLFVGKPSDFPWGQWNDRSFTEFKLTYEF